MGQPLIRVTTMRQQSFFLFYAVFFQLFSFAYCQPTVVLGSAPNLKEGTKIILAPEYPYPGIFQYVQREYVTTVKNSRFLLSFKLDAPEQFRMYVKPNDKTTVTSVVFLESGRLTMTIEDSALKKVTVNGSGAQADFQNFVRQMAESMEDEAYSAFLKTVLPRSAGLDSISRIHHDSLRAAREKSFSKIARRWIYENRNSAINSFVINKYLYGKKDDLVLAKLFQLMSSGSKKNTWGRELNYLLTNLSIGKILPTFTLRDTSQKPVSLSDYRGKYVLVDFWASWCVPCRKENKLLAELYSRHHCQGFTILSVSVDEQRPLWLTAIQADQMSWVNVSDLKGWRSDVVRQYNLKEIPSNFLLDRHGRILAKNVHGDELSRVMDSIFNREVRRNKNLY